MRQLQYIGKLDKEQFRCVAGNIATAEDPAGFSNSVISAWVVREKEYRRLVRSRKILYKRE